MTKLPCAQESERIDLLGVKRERRTGDRWYWCGRLGTRSKQVNNIYKLCQKIRQILWFFSVLIITDDEDKIPRGGGNETYGRNDGKGGESWLLETRNKLYRHVSLRLRWQLQPPVISSLSPSSLAFLPVMSKNKHQMQYQKNICKHNFLGNLKVFSNPIQN